MKVFITYFPRTIVNSISALTPLIIFTILSPTMTIAQKNSWWALPGQQFDIYAQNWYACSVGFPASDSFGNRYFITAGHCFRNKHGIHYLSDAQHNLGINIYSANNHYRPVGREYLHTNLLSNGTYLDASLVRMYNGQRINGNGWHNIPNTPHEAILQEQACLATRHDYRTRCGSITNTHITSYVKGYPWPLTVDEVHLCSYHGDSGGAVFDSHGALGILTSGSNKHCNSTFTPITDILAYFHSVIPSLTIE